MSDGVLSADQIAALFDAADRGELPTQDKNTGPRVKRVRPVDFTRPIKFTPEQIRRVRQTVDRFCQAAGTSLTAELRLPVEVELIDSAQLTWWDAHLQLSKDAINAVIEMPQIGTTMLMSTELLLILTAIENLLGGSTQRSPRTRRLSDIDRRLASRVIEGLVHQLSTPWFDLARVSLRVTDFDTPSDDTQLASASEPTLVLVLEVRLAGASHTITILIPYTAIHPVEEAIMGRGGDDGDGNDPRIADAVGAVLRDVEVTVRAAAPSVEMPIEQVLSLKPGDIVRLEAPVARGVTVYRSEERRVGKVGGC